MVAELYVKAAKHPGAKVWAIMQAVTELRDLGDLYPEGSPRRKLYHEMTANARAELLKPRNY